MTSFDRYVFVLCLVVFLLLTLTFTYMIWKLYRMSVHMIRAGLQDEKIRAEAHKKVNEAAIFRTVSNVFSILVSTVLVAAFAFSFYLNMNEDKYFDDVPVMRVVQSSSMEKKHEKNTYLKENGLDDQFAMFDVIFVYKVPPAEELKLYDIVVYDLEGVKVVHRIVGIEEPNLYHPNERHFLIQGDAVERPDRFPVKYEQIEAIYRGESVPFIGSFISFMQSPAGWMCVILAVFSVISSFWIEGSLNKEKLRRRMVIGDSVYMHDWAM